MLFTVFRRFCKICPDVLLIFGHGKKEKTAGKAALCLKIFTCILSDLMIDYRYVARQGCLPLWCRQRSRRPRIETIAFLVKEKHLIYVFVSRGGCSARGIWSNSPDTRIEIIIFSVTEKEWVRFLIFPTRFLF